MLTISSKKNLDDLGRLAAINARLADPRGLSEAQAQQLAAQGKPFYYVQAGIHATEVGNSQAMIEIAHRLATDNSPAIRHILDNAVILMVPSQNPDGLHLVKRLLQRHGRHELQPDLSRPVPEVHRPRRQTATGSCSPRSRAA